MSRIRAVVAIVTVVIAALDVHAARAGQPKKHESVELAFAAQAKDPSFVAIHPNQIAIINRIFTPSERELERARRIVAAFREAGDQGVIGLDGEMLDVPHLRRAERLIARAGHNGGQHGE